MSFNRLNYDMCQYKQSIHESTRPGNYMIATPPVNCDYCYPQAPTVRLQKAGDSINRSKALIDTDSELRNIRQYSKCPEQNFLGGMKKAPKSAKKLHPEIRESFVNPDSCCKYPAVKNSFLQEKGLTHFPDCFPHTIESRHADPAANLRGTGFDRWEYLCFNPQENVLMPFDYNVSNRIVVKDNHRPCVPCPLDPKNGLPPNTGAIPCEKTVPVCSVPTYPSGNPCKPSKGGFYTYK